MAKKQAEKTVSDYLYDYQTRLQGVANDLGVRLSALLFTTDAKVLSLLRKELPKYKRGALAEMKRLEKIISKIEAVRDPSYSAAKDLILETSADIVQAATTETAKEFNRALAEQRQKIREKRFCKELTKKQQEAIIDGQGIDGATISDWFWKWKRDDLERLASLTKRASVERMSLAQITRAAKGSIENNYSDGVFTESKVSAARMARTIVNGVSNNARVETIVQNSDAIDGVKFIGTLDGKTCPYCASYDGYIWRGEEIAEARRPPIHPNCRCCLIPYVELKDDEGNVVDVDGERPAANADFDKLAQDAYNERAREKGWKRRWDDLSPSTRLKYYYQAQKDFEAETGKPAYRQVSGATTFQEYFHRQPDSFKRAWLGAKRYELYKSGKLKEKNIFKPDLTYQVSVESLVRDGVRSIAQETIETIPDKAKKIRQKKVDPENDSLLFDDSHSQNDGIPKIDIVSPKESNDSGKNAEPHVIDVFNIESIASGIDSDPRIARAREKYRQRMEEIGKEYEDSITALSSDLTLGERFNEILEFDKNRTNDKVEEHEALCRAYWDVILPVNNPNSKNVKRADSLWKKSYDTTDKNIYAQGAREGLRFIARICDNYGIALKDVGELTFDKELGDESRYSVPLNEIQFDKKFVLRGPEGTIRTAIHEIGHAIEKKAKKEKLGEELLNLLDNISQKDEKEEYILTRYGTSLIRVGTINVPDLYALKESRDSQGNRIGVELLSTFFQQIYVEPWLLQDYNYHDYYQKILSCIKDVVKD